MSRVAALLRIILCLALALNGAGSVVAATRMALAPDVVAAPEPATGIHAMASPTAACHQHHGMDPPVAGGASQDGVEPADHEGAPQSPDRCKSSCDCACMQSTPATVAALKLPTVAVTRVADTRRAAPSRPAPALPHLIRPPIG
jgi:hypothetical protein